MRAATTPGCSWPQYRNGLRIVAGRATMRAVLGVLPTCAGSQAISTCSVIGLRTTD